MASYIQTTIHSKIAKQEKTSSDGFGSLARGRIAAGRTAPKQGERELDLRREIEILPKSKVNVSRKMRNKVIPAQVKGEEIVLMQSGVFPAIYFKKTTMRNILKEFVFPADVRALPPADDRTPLIFQIVSNLFNEITFYIFNILIGENTTTGSFYVFFSDSETIPFTKCCNAPVYVELQTNGSGKILCNALKCPHSNIAEFLINFQDGRKLWHNITYFSEASEKDRELRARISKVIRNGKYKKVNLVGIVQDTSKQIVDLFYDMKKNKQEEQEEQPEEDFAAVHEETPFITGGQYGRQGRAGVGGGARSQPNQEGVGESMQELLQAEEKDVECLKLKIGYMVKQDHDIQRKIARSIVSEGKVFQKNFEMIKKIDQFMLTQKSSKHNTKISFPRLMDQLRKTKTKESNNDSKNRSLSAYHSFL